jgi:hypothetical protein
MTFDTVEIHSETTVSVDDPCRGNNLHWRLFETIIFGNNQHRFTLKPLNSVQELYPQIETHLQFSRIGKNMKDERVNEKQAYYNRLP